jgi:hypothetical protein
MKIDINTRQQMKNDIKVICDYFFPKGITELSIGNMHNVWFQTFCNRNYHETNGNVISIEGKRLLDQDLNYEIYPCNSNDNSLQTALISIFKELGINVLKS